jgi:Sulfotransferase family
MPSASLVKAELPFFFSLINSAFSPLCHLSPQSWGLEIAQLQQAARRQTGLQDFGDDAFFEPADRFIREALDTGLSFIGYNALKRLMIQNLSNRLYIQELLRRHPEIREIPIERPVFVVGFYRSGTTALHRLLSLDPGVRAPAYWELQEPCPPSFQRDEPPDRRLQRAKRDLAALDQLCPRFQSIHPLAAEDPEECQILLENYRPTTRHMLYQVPEYGRWILDQGMEDAYRYYRLQLQILLWQRPGRLVLKWPQHLWHLDDLIRVFPDACIIQTHRAPGQVLASMALLMEAQQLTQHPAIDRHILGNFVQDTCAIGIQNAMRVRQTADPAHFYDCHFQRLVRDQIAEQRRIYDRFGFMWNEEVESRARAHLAAHPAPASSKPRLEDYGLSEESVRHAFSFYLGAFSGSGVA